MILELVAALALVAGVIFLSVELRRLLARVAMLDRHMRAARGEMAEVIDGFFTEWSLTPSERDVALMVLKGIDNDTIANLRGTAPGTVRAQCTAVYAKAGVDGRAQLFSVFMEELLAGEGASVAAD
jgi:DNA-binding CsgD family transcriptional regulator